MENDGAITRMLNHYSVKEIMTLRKLHHPNIAFAEKVQFNHYLNDLTKFDPDKKTFKMYIEIKKAKHDLKEVAKHSDTMIKLTSP
jgi:hypothetical protein